MKKTLLNFGLFLSISFVSVGQQTSNYINNWHIGTSTGVSFNSGSPAVIPSAITCYEVSTTASDGDGRVLFYAGAINATAYGAGFTVWDASDATMPNGDVAIDYSSSCGLATAPIPGDCDKHFIFSLSAESGINYGLRTSTIDMSLPGNGTVPAPLGDVVAGQKDVLIFSTVVLAEKIKIVQKGSTENYWVICRSSVADIFYSFEVTSAGVNPVPVVSTISATLYPSPIGSPLFGWLAINKDRNLIAEANGFGPDVKLYNFDNMTGLLSNGEVLIPTGVFGTDIPYGIEFSHSGNVLYTIRLAAGTLTYLSSFDITAGVGSIAATMQDFFIGGPSPSGDYGALTKAPDGKIYGTRFGYTSLISIDTPENYLAPNLNLVGFNPAPGTVVIGMPNISYYYHPDNFIDTMAGIDRLICPSDQAIIGATGYDSIWSTYSWEPSAMVLNPASTVTQTVSLVADQEFVLHTIRECGDTIKTDTVMVLINCLLPVELIDFEAQKRNDESLLTWTTVSEINNDRFEIERSTTGEAFELIGEVQGAGNSQSKIDYSFIDRSPRLGIYYYRLKQLDYNGDFEYSEVRAVQFEGKNGVQVYPNPAVDAIVVESSDIEMQGVMVFNNTAKLLLQERFNDLLLKKEIAIDDLESGAYWLQIQLSDGSFKNIKFIKI
jgi:hypothetical protein